MKNFLHSYGSCKEVVEKYNTLKEFLIAEQALYRYIVRHKWTELFEPLKRLKVLRNKHKPLK